MIPFTLYLAYVAACAAIVIVPGPTVTVIIANSLKHGARAGLLNVAGTQAGLAIMLGILAAGLSTLEIVRFHPFTGEVESFDTMPGKGRVAVSPSGKLWYTPVKYLANLPLKSFPLPDSF